MHHLSVLYWRGGTWWVKTHRGALGSPWIHRKLAARRYGFIEVPTPHRAQRTANAMLTKVCRDLKLDAPRIRWFRVQRGTPNLDVLKDDPGLQRLYTCGATIRGLSLPDLRTIWVRATSDLPDLAFIVAHECRHVWQDTHTDVWAVSTRESEQDADDYAWKIIGSTRRRALIAKDLGATVADPSVRRLEGLENVVRKKRTGSRTGMIRGMAVNRGKGQ